MNVTSAGLAVQSLNTRLLLGAGPSPVSPRVLKALSHPPLGHLDPQFLALIDDLNDRLRTVFGTRNATTFPISGTGSAGMEAALVNVLEPGDTAIVGVCGFFGARIAEMARRMQAKVIVVEEEWGRAIDPQRLMDAHRDHPEARVLAVVHAETSTGVRQPIEELGAYLRDHETLFLVDAVTSLGGIPVEVDAVGIDICYSGTQKCIGGPPGLSPITFSPKAEARTRSRKSSCASWYLDVTLIQNYVGSERRYHHTAPSNLFFACHEALREIEEEGIEVRRARHLRVGARLKEEMMARGFTLFTDPNHLLPQVAAVYLPNGLEEAPLRLAILDNHGIEVSGGLGPAKGKIWRIGMMGHGAHDESVDRVLSAIDQVLGGR
jgi:alanine-glyoxylate transaminase/serine-glyoxylate transaminase/serine-pyruvate transaminase